MKGGNYLTIFFREWSSLVRGKWIERRFWPLASGGCRSSLVRGKWIERSRTALYAAACLSSLVRGGLVENNDVKIFIIECNSDNTVKKDEMEEMLK